jgi:hypothetical protein
LARIGLEKTSDGRTRIAEPTDFVRIEVEAALRKDIPVVPVLVAKAVMPNPNELPEALQAFAYRNAVKIDAFEDFDHHLRRLIQSLDRLLQSAGVRPPRIEVQKGAEQEREIAAKRLAEEEKSRQREAEAKRQAEAETRQRLEEERRSREMEAQRLAAQERDNTVGDVTAPSPKLDDPQEVAGARCKAAEEHEATPKTENKERRERPSAAATSVPWRIIAGSVAVISVLGVIAVVAGLPSRSPVAPQSLPAVTSPPAPSLTPQDANAMFNLGSVTKLVTV